MQLAWGPQDEAFRDELLAFLDAHTLISGSRDHTIKFWDLSPLEEVPDR